MQINIDRDRVCVQWRTRNTALRQQIEDVFPESVGTGNRSQTPGTHLLSAETVRARDFLEGLNNAGYEAVSTTHRVEHEDQPKPQTVLTIWFASVERNVRDGVKPLEFSTEQLLLLLDLVQTTHGVEAYRNPNDFAFVFKGRKPHIDADEEIRVTPEGQVGVNALNSAELQAK